MFSRGEVRSRALGRLFLNAIGIRQPVHRSVEVAHDAAEVIRIFDSISLRG
jgi:hypothetical protein